MASPSSREEVARKPCDLCRRGLGVACRWPAFWRHVLPGQKRCPRRGRARWPFAGRDGPIGHDRFTDCFGSARREGVRRRGAAGFDRPPPVACLWCPSV